MAESLSNVDAAWLHMEQPNNLMMITGVFVFKGPVDFERLKTTLGRRFLRLERFRQRVVEPRFGLGLPHWEIDPHFDISNHVHHIALPSPGDQTALQELVSDLMSMPLDYSKPLWQFHLVEGVDGGCALVGRLHHCIGDGIALMRVLLSMTDATAEETWAPPEPEEREPGRSPFRIITRPAAAAVDATRRLTGALLSESVEMLTNPGHALNLARLGTETTMALGRLVLLPPDPKTIYKGPLQVQKRAAWSPPIPLGDIKAIGRVTGTTINDVLMSTVAGGLRRYLQMREQPVEGLNFRVVVPVNLRPNAVDTANQEIELGNRFGLFFLSLPIGLEDPFERLMETKRRMDQLKATPEAVVAFGILNAIGMAPTEIENIVVDIFGTKATAVLTNVPGPKHQRYFAGAAIRELMFWVPQSGRLGLGISLFSYNDQVWIGLATDAWLVPDPDNILTGFYEELEDLNQLARQATGPAPSASRDSDLQAPTSRPVSQPAPTGPAAQLARVQGIDAAVAARLYQAGIDSVEGLSSASVEELASMVQAPEWRRPDYEGWIKQAQVLAGKKTVGGPGMIPGGEERLTLVRGIGPVLAGRLHAAGIDSLEMLSEATPEQLATIIQAPEWRRPNYQDWVDQAKSLTSPSGG